MPNIVLVSPLVVLLAFYLYLLANWSKVKRPLLFLLGVVGVLFALIGGFFTVGSTGISNKGEVAGVKIVQNIFELIGVLVALAAGVLACFGGDLPVKLPGAAAAPTEAPKEE